ncbi:MAG: transglutaminase-like cysteine peptidase [Alphaproteobacteria bacterium]
MNEGWRRRGLNFALGGSILLAAALGAPGTAVATSVPDYPQLFGSNEIHSMNLAPFAKWKGVLDRYFDEVALAEGNCQATSFNKCHLQDWGAFLEGLRGDDPMEQLDRVNRYMNEAPYITDPRNYNVADHWATLGQFFNRGGDCEDYAIAKFMSLRALGWDNAHMRIVLVQDLNLKIPHAVLVVYRDGVAWVLDNQFKQLIAADDIHHYRPVFSLNED